MFTKAARDLIKSCSKMLVVFIACAIAGLIAFIGQKYFFPLIVVVALAWVYGFIIGIILIVHTVSLIWMLCSPDKEATKVAMTRTQVMITLKDGTMDTISHSEIRRISVIENTQGMVIFQKDKSDAYTLPLTYAQIEEMVDKINDPIIYRKEKSLQATNETVDPNKDLTGVKTSYESKEWRGGQGTVTTTTNIESKDGKMCIDFVNVAFNPFNQTVL
ncbi:MAG TPA: hypothetical protein VK158_04815 [Acidobacteriota bacterium]|nr:hypothetical protein [Acidobacteriota bacterium]